MFSRDNNAYKAKSRYNELHISKKIRDIVDVMVAEDIIYEKRGFNDRVRGVAFQSAYRAIQSSKVQPILHTFS